VVRRTRPRPTTAAVPSPADLLGYEMGAERRLPDWPEIVAYFRRLAESSDRVTVEELGMSTNGAPLIAVAVADPARLTPVARGRNRDLLGRLWDPRGRSDAEIEEAIAEARSVAIILATQHANEIGAALMTLELAYELATGEDAESREIRANTLTLLIPSGNPDGVQMIVDWYRRWLDTPYEGCGLPWLYHPYVGHDNNRDWFMLTQVETQLYAALHNREHPQLVLDMHQMGRDGARFMVPPFIDPLDPNQDPTIQQGFVAVGSEIAARLTAAGKPGVATHIRFDNYSPSLAYGNYHGSVDLLSEAASCRLATSIELREEQLTIDDKHLFDPKARTWNHPLPWKGGAWTLHDIVSYDKLAARAFLEHAAKYRERWLRDYLGINRRAVERDGGPAAFVFPVNQRDPQLADELLQTLSRGAVEVDEATSPFTADGVTYPAGTRVVRLGQPAGNFAKTLLENQQYPDLRKWPDGPPRPPYDIAGHTLPLQMGVRAVEITSPFDAELRRMEEIITPPGEVTGEGVHGWAFEATRNGSIPAINRLLAAGCQMHRATERLPGSGLAVGSVVVPRADGVEPLVRQLATETGVDFLGLDGPVEIDTLEQRPVRLGLYQSWAATIDEGWARWVLEQHLLPFQTLHNGEIRQGDLATQFDVILLPHDEPERIVEGTKEKNDFDEPYPPEYTGGLGDVGFDALRAFVAAGGTLIALDGACEPVVQRFALPVRNVLEGVPETEFYCPGSLLRVVVDSAHPLGFGLGRETTVMFLNSPAFELTDPEGTGTVAARYPTSDPNLSGWILGPDRLRGKAALVDLSLDAGRVVLVGFRPHFRAQMRGTYHVLFNAIASAGYRPSRLTLG